MNAIVACALHPGATRKAAKTASATMGGQVEADAMTVRRLIEITAEMGETTTTQDPPTMQEEVTNTRATEERGSMTPEGAPPSQAGLVAEEEEGKINLEPLRDRLYSLLQPLLSLDQVHNHSWHSSSLLHHNP